MYGNNNSLTTYKKFQILDNQEKIKNEESTKRNKMSDSLMPRRNNSMPTNNTSSPAEIAYRIYSAINKERINARTTK
tara:strand:+ start:73 stop:303 length:231 start_codon:yes stop_codon:yes gene_type:complete